MFMLEISRSDFDYPDLHYAIPNSVRLSTVESADAMHECTRRDTASYNFISYYYVFKKVTQAFLKLLKSWKHYLFELSSIVIYFLHHSYFNPSYAHTSIAAVLALSF